MSISTGLIILKGLQIAIYLEEGVHCSRKNLEKDIFSFIDINAVPPSRDPHEKFTKTHKHGKQPSFKLVSRVSEGQLTFFGTNRRVI